MTEAFTQLTKKKGSGGNLQLSEIIKEEICLCKTVLKESRSQNGGRGRGFLAHKLS